MRLASPVALQMDFVSPILQESRLGLQKVYDSWKVTGSGGLPWWLSGKEFTCQCRRHGLNKSLHQEDPLEKEMATHSSKSQTQLSD